MANYGINIDVKIKAGQLTNFNRTLDQTDDKINKVNEKLKGITSLIPKSIKPLTQSFNDLSAVVSKANAAFNKSTLGTPQATQAARNLVKANEEFNIGLEKRAKLLEKVTFEMKMQQLAAKGIRPATVSSTPFGPMPMMTVNNNPRIMRNIAASQAARQDTNFGFGLAGDPVAKSIRRNQQKREKLLQKELKIRQNILQVEKLSLKVASAEKSTKAFGVSGGQIGPALPRFFSLKQQFAQGGMFAATRGERFRGAASNALIGGGFPLLFGQGALGAAGGGIGGAAGGALGGGFGFGLSIAGTALATRIQESIDFRKSVAELNKEMERMGISSNISSRSVINLGKSLGITKQEAVQTLQEFKRFGKDAVLFAEKFRGDFGKFEAVGQATDIESTLAAIKKFNKDLTLEEELRFIRSLRIKGAEKTINDLLTDSLDKQKQLETKGFGQGEGLNPGANRKRKGQLDQEKEATQDIIDKNTELTEKLINVRDLNRQIKEESIMASISISETMKDLNFEMKKLNDRQFQVIEFSKTMGSSFEESFKGIIKGTMSVGNAFSNMLNRMADHFLDMAAKMMANQFQRGILGLLGQSLTGGLGGGNNFTRDAISATSTLTPEQQVSRFTFGRANGGPVRGGNSYIVGERGPELFSPGVSGMITPNHALGGSTSVVVNVDASGSSVEGDDQSAARLGEAIASAVQAEIVNQKMSGGLLS